MKEKIPGIGGNIYIPESDRTGSKSKVYFTRDLSANGLIRIFDKVGEVLGGRIAIKLHTGEPHGPNIIPREWVKALIDEKLSGASIVETNSYYEGPRSTTEGHLDTLKINGWDFAPVDILDSESTVRFEVKDGKWFDYMSVGSHLENYDSVLALTHFKGHVMGGFGGSNKNLGIGCADGRVGKKMIHTAPGNLDMWSITQEEFMERMTESTKSVVDHFAGRIAFINVMRNMSVSCDCEGTAAEPVVTPNVGIVASLDLLAVDQASVDLIYAMKESDNKALVERIETRHGLRQLSYMKELGMGCDRYELIDIDSGDMPITPSDAVSDVVKFEG